jgi:hypothetical protein
MMLPRIAKLAVLASLLYVPTTAYAQASITGVVRDTSGAVLPGVTVEAASPVLIEKVRSVVSDGTGQYRIENLRPGPYTVTFTLPGFSTSRREGLELTGSFTATVNAEMVVGALEETLTVTGETPVVDVQSTTRQQVMNREVMDAIPSAGSAYTLGVLIPGVTFSGATQNVGGIEAKGAGGLGTSIAIHGGGSQGITLNGTNIMGQGSSGASATIRPNPAAMQEIVFDTTAVNAEQSGGGVRINYIPKDGGNRFTGTFIGSVANKSMQSNNFTQELKDRGLGSPNRLDQNWDVDPGVGGPIARDRAWFFGAARYVHQSQYAAGMFHNRNLNNPNAWTFDPDPSRPVINDTRNPDTQLRLAWLATPKQKVGFVWYNTTNCFCPTDASSTVALEAAARRDYPLQRLVQVDWTSPLTNRLLFEAGANYFWGESNDVPLPELAANMIQVTEQSTGLVYRGAGSGNRILKQQVPSWRFTTSYITGAHSYKFGINDKGGHTDFHGFDLQPLGFRFNNGVPNQLTQRAYPFDRIADVSHDMGVFAQDRWTIDRMTIGYGIRYDYFENSFPEQHIGPALLAPNRNLTFPKRKNIAYHDITPKLGLSYDMFGTGKTALKLTMNRYLSSIGIGDNTFGTDANPVQNLVLSTTRTWTDANRNFVPDCNLTLPSANGECGQLANTDFGGVRPGSTWDSDLLRGWGKRNYNWEFSAGVQHELLPKMAVDVSYFRKWFGNFVVTDNQAVSPADYDTFSVTAPRDPRLPGGGAYAVSGLFDLNPSKFGVPANNLVTLSSKYGEQVQYWQGADVNINMRPAEGVLLQGGTSTGRTVTDNCEVLAKLPELGPTGLPYCRVVPLFLTQVKFLGSYLIPRVGVQVSGAYQSLPGPQVAANLNVPNAAVVPSLGRSLSGNAANVTVNLVEPGAMFGDRLNQLDLRFSKILRVASTSTRLNVDLYNALNSNAVIAVNNNYGAWLQPTTILLARFVKLGIQFDF